MLRRESASTSRESNDADSAGRFRYCVDVSQDWRFGVFHYRVKVTSTSDNTSKICFKSFDDFVSFDSDLRQNTTIFHRNPSRGGIVPRFPAKRNVLALWGRRHQLWLEGMPARFQQYLEDVLQRISVNRFLCASIRVNRFLCAEIAGPLGGVRQLLTTPYDYEALFNDDYEALVTSEPALEGRRSWDDMTEDLVTSAPAWRGSDSVVADDMPRRLAAARQSSGVGLWYSHTAVHDCSQFLEVQQGSGESCVICQEDFQPHDKVRALACGHTYHLDCISRWLAVRSACCLCLRPAVPVEVDRLEA